MVATEVLVSWADIGIELGYLAKFAMGALYFAIAAPFLLGGTWASPGNRVRELGLTLMIASAAAIARGAIFWVTVSDPAVARMMPRDQPMPNIGIDPLFGTLNTLAVAAAGFFLHWIGRRRAFERSSNLGQVFE